jgi:hypothetical protein
VNKARSLHERCSSPVGSVLICKCWTRLERLCEQSDQMIGTKIAQIFGNVAKTVAKNIKLKLKVQNRYVKLLLNVKKVLPKML